MFTGGAIWILTHGHLELGGAKGKTHARRFEGSIEVICARCPVTFGGRLFKWDTKRGPQKTRKRPAQSTWEEKSEHEVQNPKH